MKIIPGKWLVAGVLAPALLALVLSAAAWAADPVQKPPLASGFWWHLGENPPTNPPFEVVDIDWEDATAAEYAALKANGKYVIAYVSVGSWEDWRGDAGAFPQSVLGNDYDGWPGERWLDLRRIDVLLPIMERRFDVAKAKGADAIEFDNMEARQNNPGFPITKTQQLAYIRALIDAAHQRGLAAIHKNDWDEIDDLLPYMDGCLVEDGFRYNEVNAEGYLKYLRAGKPLWTVEYRRSDYDKGVATAKAENFFLGLYDLDLDTPPLAWTSPTPAGGQPTTTTTEAPPTTPTTAAPAPTTSTTEAPAPPTTTTEAPGKGKPTTVPRKHWKDWPDYSLAEQQAVYESGVFLGYGDGTFQPWAPVLQRHVVLVMARLGLRELPESYAVASRGWVHEAFPELSFKEQRWNEPLTRFQLALLVARYLQP